MFGSALEIFIVAGLFMMAIAAISAILIRRVYRKRYALRDEYVAAERAANEVRTKEIEPEYFFAPDWSALPDNPPPNVVTCAQKQMMRFPTRMTNLEIKQRYGIGNLERVAFCEDNFSRYIAALIEWGESLLPQPEGIAILQETVKLGSDFRKTYILLADHYATVKAFEDLEHMYDQIETNITDTSTKRNLREHVSSLFPAQ